jgi:SAM-dependent methyltransferase
MSEATFELEVARGQRFSFGKNWRAFLPRIDEQRITEAEASLRAMLGEDGVAGKSVLDVGSGSGLFSLAAARLGAARVRSFDYDPQSVACTEVLRRRFSLDAARWTAERGDVLDPSYLAKLGEWDVVYSWGVLHHTGAMWHALANVAQLVRPGGRLFVSIYNDQGNASHRWRAAKRLFNSGWAGRLLVCGVGVPVLFFRLLALDLLGRRNPVARYRAYARTSRGMSMFRDWIDWLGGYPFEVAKPEAVFAFYRERGFVLERMTTCGGSSGCNQFVFSRQGDRH